MNGRLGPALAPAAVVASALVAAGPLFRGGMVPGHDAHEHVTRTAEYARALASGVWWPHWAPNLGHGYGEPLFLFNPPLFYILASVPTLAGVPVVAAVNLATALLLVVAGLGTYAWLAPAFGRSAAVVAACAYVWAPYMLLDVYVRQALTELTAVCMLPWALWGLVLASRATSRSVAVGAVPVGLLLLSSTPGTLVAAPALLGQLIASADPRRPRAALGGLAALALGALLASAFWVPASAERHLLRFDRLLVDKLEYRDHFLEPSRLVSGYWGPGVSSRGPDERLMGFGLGQVHLALAASGLGLLALRRPGGELTRRSLLALGLTGIGVGMTLEPSVVVWEQLPQLHYLQYPWRFLMLPALGCAVLAALPAAWLSRRHPRAAPALAAACALFLVVGSWTRAQPRELIPYTDARFAPAAVAGRERGRGTVLEYETIWTTRRPDGAPASRLRVITGSAVVVESAATAHEQRFSVNAESRSRLRLNTFYFPGWRVWVDGAEREIDYANPSGLIEFVVEPGESLVLARFEPTPARWIGRALSVMALGIVVLLVAWPERRQWKPAPAPA